MGWGGCEEWFSGGVRGGGGSVGGLGGMGGGGLGGVGWGVGGVKRLSGLWKHRIDLDEGGVANLQKRRKVDTTKYQIW